MASIDREKVRRELEGLIAEYERENKVQLPTEPELVKTLGLGRHTIRAVIEELVQEGKLNKIQGKGTFLTQNRSSVEFSGWIGTEPPGDEILAKIMQGYSEEHQNSRISYCPIPYYRSIEYTIKKALGGSVSDVLQLTPHFISILNDFELLLPLDSYLNYSNQKRRFSVDVESGRVGKDIYAITWALSPLILYYNKDVLRRAGLDPESPPTTLDELLEMATHINSKNLPNTWGMSIPLSVSDPIFLWLYPYFLAFNGGFCDYLNNVTIDSKENLEALAYLQRLYKQGCVPGKTDVTEGRMLFASNNIGFWIDGPFIRGLLRNLSFYGKDFDHYYDVALIPKGLTGKSESILFNHHLGISKRCKNIEVALNWIDYLCTNEEVVQYYFNESGCLPPMRDFLNKPFFAEDPFAALCIKQIETVSAMPTSHPLFAKSISFISQIISKVITNSTADLKDFYQAKEVIGMIASSAYLGIYPH